MIIEFTDFITIISAIFWTVALTYIINRCIGFVPVLINSLLSKVPNTSIIFSKGLKPKLGRRTMTDGD
jgi:hypothetical protein